MQFIDLKKQQNLIKKKIENRLQSVLDHGKYIMGPEVYELEEKLASFANRKHCISCSSGTDALLIPLTAITGYTILVGFTAFGILRNEGVIAIVQPGLAPRVFTLVLIPFCLLVTLYLTQ